MSRPDASTKQAATGTEAYGQLRSQTLRNRASHLAARMSGGTDS
jgi:hypothetical protein